MEEWFADPKGPAEGVREEGRPDKTERPIPLGFGRTEKGDLLSQMASKD